MRRTLFSLPSIVILSLTIIMLGITPLPSLAEDSSLASPSASSEVTKNLKERLQNTLSKAKQNLILSTKPKAYVGQIKDIVQQTISVTTKDGNFFVKINDNTTLLRSPGNHKIKLENVAIGDYIIAMGYPDETKDTLKGKRVLVTNSLTLELEDKTTGFAKIESIKNNTLTLSNSLTLKLTSKTVIKTKNNILKKEDLSEGQTIVFTAHSHTATNIMIVQ